jgi:hypothetical protein
LKKVIGILLAIGITAAVIYGPALVGQVSTCVVGDMSGRAQAVVPNSMKSLYLDAQQMQFGLGSGAIGGWEGLGDALAVNGLVWVRTTNTQSPRYHETVSNRYFQSNAFVYVPPGQATEISWKAKKEIATGKVWEELAAEYPDGVMLAGYVRFSQLHMIAIAKPATDGKSVTKNATHYYTRPMESVRDAWAYVVGVAGNKPSTVRPDHAAIMRLLPPASSRAGQGRGLAHVLLLKSTPENFQLPPARENVMAVGQLVTNSVMAQGELKLYPISHASECDNAIHTKAN